MKDIMEIIPQDIKLQELWQYLPYEDIVNLCQSNLEFNLICESNNVWTYLLKRDFDIIYTQENSRNMYLLYRHALNHFSEFYPIITLKALNLIIKYVPTSVWPILDEIIRKELGHLSNSILSESVILTMRSGILSKSYFIDFDNIAHHWYIPGFSEMVNRINEDDGCNEFIKLVTNPTLIFVNGILTIIVYDYDLAEAFIDTTLNPCENELETIKEYILSLI